MTSNAERRRHGRPKGRRRFVRDLVLGSAALGGFAVWSASRFGAEESFEGPVFDLRSASPDPADASPAFQALLRAIDRAGGGVLYVPPGRWRLTKSINLKVPGLVLRGAGIRATRIELADGVPGPIVSVTADGVSVERLTIVGNRDSVRPGDRRLPHGVRVGDNADFVRISDTVIEDAAGYGIGFERDSGPGTRRDGGLFSYFVLRNVSVLRSGNDGIDIKNYDAGNAGCPKAPAAESPPTPPACNGARSFMRNISIDQHGLLFEYPDRKFAIDLRGRRHLQNIDVLGVKPGAIGVGFRPEAGGAPNGKGALWSTLENCHISLVGSAGEGLSSEDVGRIGDPAAAAILPGGLEGIAEGMVEGVVVSNVNIREV